MSMSMDRPTSNRDINLSSHSLIRVSPLNEPSDRTESDATHPILRVDHRHQGERIQCLTCRQRFDVSSFSDICAHYTFYHSCQEEEGAKRGLDKCLYCLRSVHYYLRAEKAHPDIYHFCSPRKQS